MPKMIEIVIPGNPVPFKAAEFNTQKRFAYDPRAKEKEAVKWHILEVVKRLCTDKNLPLKVPIHCEIAFFFEIPNSALKTVRNLASWGLLEYENKPDVDNLLKFYLDCMKKIVYEDDRQIVSISTRKAYDKYARTEIRIMAKQKTLPEKVEDILSQMSAEEFGQLAADLEIVSDCLAMDFLAKNSDAKIKLQLEAAYMLSVFADRYGAMLSNIHKKYPGLWKSIKEFEEKVLAEEASEQCVHREAIHE